jgi:hypothetical protein
LGNTATKLGTGHSQLIAQHPQQGHFGLDIHLLAFAIDVQFQHACILGDQKINNIVNSPSEVNPVESLMVWPGEGLTW